MVEYESYETEWDILAHKIRELRKRRGKKNDKVNDKENGNEDSTGKQNRRSRKAVK